VTPEEVESAEGEGSFPSLVTKHPRPACNHYGMSLLLLFHYKLHYAESLEAVVSISSRVATANRFWFSRGYSDAHPGMHACGKENKMDRTIHWQIPRNLESPSSLFGVDI